MEANSTEVDNINPTVAEAVVAQPVKPQTYDIRPAQTDYLKAVFSRLQKYEDAVFPKVKELRAAFQEAVFFVQKDLNIPAHLQYRLNDEATQFVPVESLAQGEAGSGNS